MPLVGLVLTKIPVYLAFFDLIEFGKKAKITKLIFLDFIINYELLLLIQVHPWHYEYVRYQ